MTGTNGAAIDISFGLNPATDVYSALLFSGAMGSLATWISDHI
jgi:hypothetical protein